MNIYERIETSFRDRFGMIHTASFDADDLAKLQYCLNRHWECFSDVVRFDCTCQRFDVIKGLVASLIDGEWLVRPD